MKTFEPYIEERLKDLEVTLNSTDSKEAIRIFLNKGSSFGSNHLTTKLTIDAIRQTNENVRALRKEVISLKSRVTTLENEKDTDLL